MSHMSRAFQTSLLITAQRNDCRILCCREEAQKKKLILHCLGVTNFNIPKGWELLEYHQEYHWHIHNVNYVLCILHIYITFGFLNIFRGGKLSGVIAVVYILCQPGSINHHFGQGLFGPHEEVLLSIFCCILQ